MTKVYVIMEFSCDEENEFEGTSAVLAVATSKDAADNFVRNYKFNAGVDFTEKVRRDPDGSLGATFYMKDGHRTDVYWVEKDLID